ncbi:MAG: DUF3592 domain-containing protein [Bacteroidetes bacterium]|nr:DUF3592 domain-containing protein [Bacteroidota bacterium]
MGVATHRNIPVSTRCRILFGGFKNQFGWAFFGFGMIFFWGFAMNSDLSFLYYTGEIIRVEGIATHSFEIDATEGNVTVIENHYKFKTEDGLEFEGISYATGRSIQAGNTITIEYPEGKPQYSRIKGMRRQIFGAVALWVVLFSFVGLVFILLGLKRSIRALRLLKYGKLTKGKLISKVRTNTRVNGRIVYKLTFRFKDEIGHEFELREKTLTPHLLQNESEERLLYLRRKPAYAIMLDSLPSSVSINADGKIESSPFIRMIFVLFIPLLTLVGHGYYVVSTYVL